MLGMFVKMYGHHLVSKLKSGRIVEIRNKGNEEANVSM